MKVDQDILDFYAIGYYDGRVKGEMDDVYFGAEHYHYYKRGYDAGVSDYCHFDLEDGECKEIVNAD